MDTPWWLAWRWQNIHGGRKIMSLVKITSVCHVWTTFLLTTTFLSHNTGSCPLVLVADSAFFSSYAKINERWTGSSGRAGSQCEGSLCQTSCPLEIDHVWSKCCQLVISNDGRTVWMSGAFEKLQGFPRACLLDFSTSLTNSHFFCSLPLQCSLRPCKIYCASLTKRVLSNWENGCVYQDDDCLWGPALLCLASWAFNLRRGLGIVKQGWCEFCGLLCCIVEPSLICPTGGARL